TPTTKTCRRVRSLILLDRRRRLMTSADVADVMERTRGSIDESRDPYGQRPRIHCSLDQCGAGTAPTPALLVGFRLPAGFAAELLFETLGCSRGPRGCW